MYDVAIGAAAKAGFVHHEALANERAGIMLHEQKQDELARKHLTRARELYRTWGALAKVRDIETKFPNYLLGSSVVSNPATPKDPDHAGLADLSSVPSLDFGESQIIHFDAMAKTTEKIGGNKAHIPSTEGIVRRESRAGSGPPPVRVPVVSGNRRTRTSTRAKAGKGGRLGTPGRAPTLPIQNAEQDSVSETGRRAESVQLSDSISAEKSPKLDTSKQPDSESKPQNSQEKTELPISYSVQALATLSRSSSSLEMQTESDLSDDDLRSVQSDVSAQSDFGPRYAGEKREKKKKKLRRKLKPTTKKVSEDTSNRPLRRSHSLSSGLDAHSDTEAQVQEKPKRRLASTKKKKESSSLKRIPKRSTGGETDDQQDPAPELESEVTTGTIKMKSKAKAEEEKEINPKKEVKVRRSASVDRSSKKKGSGSKKALLDEIRTKAPRRSKSKLLPPEVDQGKQKSRSKDELLTEIKASGGNVSARRSKKKTSDSITSRNSGEGIVKPTEAKGDTEPAQATKELALDLSLSGKEKKESKREVDEEKPSAATDDSSDAVPATAPVRGIVKSLSWSGKRKDKSIKEDQEVDAAVTSTGSSEQVSTTPSSPTRGLVRSLSWNGKRKKKTKEDEGVSKSLTEPSIERRKMLKVKKEKKADETTETSLAQKAKKGLGLLVKIKRGSKKASTDSKAG
jgi:hypothetical protein